MREKKTRKSQRKLDYISISRSFFSRKKFWAKETQLHTPSKTTFSRYAHASNKGQFALNFFNLNNNKRIKKFHAKKNIWRIKKLEILGQINFFAQHKKFLKKQSTSHIFSKKKNLCQVKSSIRIYMSPVSPVLHTEVIVKV